MTVSIGTPARPALIDAAPTGIIVLDAQGRVIALNDAAGQFIHAKPDQMIGQQYTALAAALHPFFKQALAGGAVVVRQPAALHARHVTVSTFVARNDGAICSVTAELHDLTASADMASNLEHLDRLANVGVVTAGVAHEIKNALVAVRTYFELRAAGEEDMELRSVAAEEVQRIDKVVRQLLRGARREQIAAASLSIHSLLKEALALVRHELQARAIRLSLNLCAERDGVLGDERQLRHTVVNLLINAAEAMAEGGELTVETRLIGGAGDGQIQVSIADTGCGIRLEDMPRIFSPFFSTKPQGTGLGLAISRRIVQGHEGDIQVTSTAGEGTTFVIKLPLLPE